MGAEWRGRTTRDIAVSALLGEAVGDALGVPVEFMSRAEVRAVHLTEMVGADTPLGFRSRWGDIIPSGAWSDDTSMTLAAMASIAERGGEIDYDDVMRRFLDWWYRGRYTSLDSPFGLGGTVSDALRRFEMRCPAVKCGGKGVRDNGNGALMRLLPFSLYCAFRGLDFERAVPIINDASGITHAHAISRMCCMIFTAFLGEMLRGGTIREAWDAARARDYACYGPEAAEACAALLSDAFPSSDGEQIGESGYVVDTLMAAAHSLLCTSCYEDAVLRAINLGYDTDTSAAVTGALAGAYYGMEGIPERWLAKLRRRELLEETAIRFADAVAER